MMTDCPECDGLGWTGVTQPRCCGRSDWECGGRGCTGPEPELVQEQCEYCRGSGTVEDDEEEVPPFDEGPASVDERAERQDAEERLGPKDASAVAGDSRTDAQPPQEQSNAR